MKWTPWHIIACTALFMAFMAFGAYMKLYDATPLYVSLVAAVGVVAAAVAVRIKGVIEQSKAEAEKAKSEVAIERARSEIPPALQDVKIVAYRKRLPTYPDLEERAPDVPASPPQTEVKVEVKS